MQRLMLPRSACVLFAMEGLQCVLIGRNATPTIVTPLFNHVSVLICKFEVSLNGDVHLWIVTMKATLK